MYSYVVSIQFLKVKLNSPFMLIFLDLFSYIIFYFLTLLLSMKKHTYA